MPQVGLNWDPVAQRLVPQTLLLDFARFNYFTQEIYGFNPAVHISITSRTLFNPNGTNILSRPESGSNFTLYSNYKFTADGAYGLVVLETGPCVYAATGLPCGVVTDVLTVALQPFAVTPLVANQLVTGALSAASPYYFASWYPSVGMQLYVSGDPGLCFGTSSHSAGGAQVG